MNYDIFYKKRRLKSYINYNCLSGNKENMICINNNESEQHLLKKIQICLYLRKNNYTFYTEVILKNHKRCDILAISPEGNGLIIEVLNSETYEDFLKKIENYPTDIFEIIPIKISQEINEVLTI